MNGTDTIKQIAAVGALVLGITLMWQAEEITLHKKEAVQIAEQPQESDGKKENTKEEVMTTNPKILPFLEKNKDVIGYISIPGTNVNYPVLLGEDNAYYLSHNLYGETEKAGCIFADYKYGDTLIREEFGRHTLLYGHHLRNKTMFTSITKYKNEEFFFSHPYVQFDNLKQSGKWKVFSVYVLDADKETLERKFEKDEDYLAYLEKIKKRSWYPVEVDLDSDSKVLTLCTCSYETDNSRAIVHAVLVDE